MRRIAFVVLFLCSMCTAVGGEDDPITKLRDDTLGYFKPVTGTVVSVEGNKLVMSAGESSVKPGMRLKVLREGAPFIHPVTKELLGKVESTVGKVEIREVTASSSSGVMLEGDAKQGDKVRISDTRVRIFFCQDKTVDWYLADEYYRKLKETGKAELIDTALETADEAKALAEARSRGAEVALLLTAKEADKGTLLRERVYWVSDGSKFVDMEVTVNAEYAKGLKFGAELFTPRSGEAVLRFDLPYGARFVAAGDVDGDGKKEIIISTGKDVRAYTPGADLQFLWEVKGSASDDHIWLDTLDLNKNGREELIITSMKSGEIVSYIYEFAGPEFRKVWEGKYFLRRLEDGLIAQAYSAGEGFSGDILTMTWSGEYKPGEKITVPKGINIYDFVRLDVASGEKKIFAYDDYGFLNLFDEKGTRVWRSASNTGGFITTFKRQAPVSYVDSGEWAVKDRLFARQREVLVLERVPLTEKAKGVGYKSSRLRNYWWNGFAMEEGTLVDNIKGNLLDYSISGEQLIILTRPILGIKFENILKGENPLGTVLSIYSVKGR